MCITEGSQGGNSSRAGTRRQELKPKPWRKAILGLADISLPPDCSACLCNLFYTTQDHLPRRGTSHSGLPHPHISQPRKCPIDYRLIWWRQFLYHMVCVKLTKPTSTSMTSSCSSDDNVLSTVSLR